MITDIYTTDKKYNIIYADPPWKYKTWREGTGTAEKHYPTMKLMNTETPLCFFQAMIFHLLLR